MAKDGTARGGARPNAGRKPKALNEKIEAGNPGGRELKVIDFDTDAATLDGEEMPPVKDYLYAAQKDGSVLFADEIYKETWEWLHARKCDKLISPQTISQYAMATARWIQCEKAISEFGFLAKHPTTGGAMTSPYVSMSQNFMKQSNQLWFQIFQVVKENCSVEYSGQTPQDSAMERLLRARNL